MADWAAVRYRAFLVGRRYRRQWCLPATDEFSDSGKGGGGSRKVTSKKSGALLLLLLTSQLQRFILHRGNRNSWKRPGRSIRLAGKRRRITWMMRVRCPSRTPTLSHRGAIIMASVMGMVHVLMICPWGSMGESPEGLGGFLWWRVAGTQGGPL